MKINAIQPATFFDRKTALRRYSISSARSASAKNPGEADDSDQVAAEIKQKQAEQEQINKLSATDRAVRAHESAHMAAAAGLAVSGPTFEYERGPDGRMYAVAGEVHIEISGGGSPEETLAKARQIRAAALAPGDPSAQDMAVANQVAQLENEALQDIRSEARTTSDRETRQILRYTRLTPQAAPLLWAEA